MSIRNRTLRARRSFRLPGYDYSQTGAYFLTICAHQKTCLFGEIHEGNMFVYDLGKSIEDCWQKIPQLRPNITLDSYVVMPNHFHGILLIHDTDLAGNATELSQETPTISPGKTGSSLGVIIGQFKRAVTIRSKTLAQPPAQPIWQRSFYEHIIRNERTLVDVRRYIVENPGRWRDDSLYVDQRTVFCWITGDLIGRPYTYILSGLGSRQCPRL